MPRTSRRASGALITSHESSSNPFPTMASTGELRGARNQCKSSLIFTLSLLVVLFGNNRFPCARFAHGFLTQAFVPHRFSNIGSFQLLSRLGNQPRIKYYLKGAQSNSFHRNSADLLPKRVLYSQNENGDTDNNSSPQSINEPQVNVSPQNPPTIRNKEPSISDMMRIMGTSPRRIFLSIGSATSIALTANFFGITSNLLSALPEEFSETTGLDSFYPRNDFKRVTVRNGLSGMAGAGVGGNPTICKCSFLIPKDWVADTGLALAQAQRNARSLDYSMRGGPSSSTLPDAAYGPPGKLDSRGLSNGDTNVSVIINDGVRNFSLKESLGDPTAAAKLLLSSKFGPRSPTTLLSAFEEQRGEENTPVYQFEYTVDRSEKGRLPLRAVSVVAGSRKGDAFVTLTVVSLDSEWKKSDIDVRLRRIAKSFKLV